MQKAVLIFILCIVLLQTLHAQNEVTIRGMVKDSMGAVLSKATVRLIITHDTLSTLTKEDGSFSFHLAAASAFELLVTMKGYTTLRKALPASPGSGTINLPPILLQAAYGELAPVTVLHIKPYTIKEDTVEYHTRAYAIRPGAELEALLKKLPGMLVDPDGTVTVQGKKISRVQVNGKDYPGDPLTVIRNFPVDIIEAIQVIDDYGDKARLTGVKSGESEKILNVLLKKDKKNGEIGKLDAGAGNKDRYNAVLFSNLIRGDRQMNITAWLRNQNPLGNTYERGTVLGYGNTWNKKWVGRLNLGSAGDEHSLGSSQVQEHFIGTSRTHSEQVSRSSGYKGANSISTNLEYRPDLNSFLSIYSFLGSYHNGETVANELSARTQDSGFTKSNTGDALNSIKERYIRSESRVYFEKIYPASKSRMSAELSYHSIDGSQDGANLSHTSIQTGNDHSFSQQQYLTQSKNSEREMTGRWSYYFSLGAKSFLELGYEGHFSRTENGRDTRAPDSSNRHLALIDSLSNHYTFRTVTNRLHASYLLHADKINMTLDLGAQPASQAGRVDGKTVGKNYTYINVLPLAQFSWSFSPGRKLNFEYSGTSTLPMIEQLQPLTDLSNPQYPVTGNPDLKPSYIHNLKLHYEQFAARPGWLNGFGAEVNYTGTEGLIISSTTHPRDTSAVVQSATWVNANGARTIEAGYHLDFAAILHKRLHIFSTGKLTNNRMPSLNDQVLFLANSWGWTQGLRLKLDLPNKLEAAVYGNYTNTINRYATGLSPTSLATANWGMYSKAYLFQKWSLTYSLTQFFSSGISRPLFTNPALINTIVEREFFRNNQCKISFSVNDLFNAGKGVVQIITPTSTTLTRTPRVGRTFQVSIQLKGQSFHR